MIRIVAICLMLLAACTTSGGRTVVQNDYGGAIPKYQKKYEHLKKSSTKVTLCGNIGSAATIFVSLPNVCACPEAKFLFHGARIGFLHSPEYTEVMADYYPKQLRTWYMREAGHLILTDHVTLTTQDLITMNILEAC